MVSAVSSTGPNDVCSPLNKMSSSRLRVPRKSKVAACQGISRWPCDAFAVVDLVAFENQVGPRIPRKNISTTFSRVSVSADYRFERAITLHLSESASSSRPWQQSVPPSFHLSDDAIILSLVPSHETSVRRSGVATYRPLPLLSISDNIHRRHYAR